MITDGPFAETKEQLGGYYILDCQTWMKQLPGPRGSAPPCWDTQAVEIRPLPGLARYDGATA